MSPMSLRTTAARMVGGMITAIRIPADMTLWVVGRAPLGGVLQEAVESADANVRDVAGRILGSDELRERTTSPTAEAPAEQPKSDSKHAERPESQRKSRQSNGTKTSARKDRARRSKAPVKQPRQARPGEAVSGFPEPPGKDPGDISRDPEPHHSLSHPVGEPDPTEWPDPYDPREDPRDPPDPDGQPFGDEPHVSTGSISTSEPHPSEDLEAGERQNAPERDRLDD
jgi:hypothetical protein